MKKLLISSVFSLLTAIITVPSPASAQSYIIYPAYSVSDTLDLANADTSTLDIKIKIISQISSKLKIKWHVIEDVFDTAWYRSVCDHLTCYTGYIPADTTMSPIEPYDTGFIKLSIYPANVAGSGRLILLIYTGGNPATGDTLSFFATITGTGIVYSYTLAPSKNNTGILSIADNPNSTVDVRVNIKNNLNTTLNLNGKIVENTLLSGWVYAISDHKNSYSMPVPGTMVISPVFAYDTGFVMLSVYPNNIPGDGRIKLRIYSNDTTVTTDTITFQVSINTGIEELKINDPVHFTLSPDRNTLFIETAPAEEFSTEIYGMNGNKIRSGIPVKKFKKIDISELSDGYYMIHLRSVLNPEIYMTKKIIINR